MLRIQDASRQRAAIGKIAGKRYFLPRQKILDARKLIDREYAVDNGDIFRIQSNGTFFAELLPCRVRLPLLFFKGAGP